MRAALIILAFATSILAGCAEVKPWQKQNLARPQMALDSNPLESKFMRHLYDSKEGSSGGYGVGGGGCGCN